MEVQRTKVHPCTLQERGIRHGSRLECEDFLQKYEFCLIVHHERMENDLDFVLGGDAGQPNSEAEVEKATDATAAAPADDEDDLVLVMDVDTSTRKRRRDSDDGEKAEDGKRPRKN